MKQRAIAVAIATLAGALLTAVLGGHRFGAASLAAFSAVGITVAAVLFAAAALMLLTSFDRGRTSAAIRIDWFLPFLRRLKNDQRASHSSFGRLARRIIPQSMQSDRSTKKRGLVRKALRRFGLSWRASPLRRVVQTLCLLTFAVLFFYVCWPYSARPHAPGHVSSDWTFKEIDQHSGVFYFGGTFDRDWTPQPSDTLFVIGSDPSAGVNAAAGAFTVDSLTPTSIGLRLESEVTPEVFDAFFTSELPWSLHESDPQAWPSHYADELSRKELIPAETFLILDPLVSLSTAIASRSWVWSLVSAAIILIVCALIPRGFCGYLCPLGTTIDLFDWAVTSRVKRFRVAGEGWWVHIKYYLLAGTLVCASFGVLASGFFSAIPIITRGMLFLFDPLQTGAMRGWHLIPAAGAGQLFSIFLFFAVLSLGFFRARFWCKYVCPSGAIFSLGNLFRVTERKVESSCIHCNKCVEICPFDAIKPDFTTRATDCTMCQSCGGVCPTHAIKFVERWNVVELKVVDDPATHETAMGRRGFLSFAGGTATAVAGGIVFAGITKTVGANLDDPNAFRPVRPPGSVPEQQFLEMCIRCGECFKACPNNVLQAEGFQQGLEGLWAPMVVADWAGCESSCNACGQVCPTGAIRALPIAEKRFARMGLAIVNETTCLPFAGRQACDLCVQECDAAGYHALEFTQVGTKVDDNGQPIEGTGYLAPVVIADQCVGCGLCQTRCHAINVKENGLLEKSAIIIEAGDGKEDRILNGSYRELRKNDAARQADSATPSKPSSQPDSDVTDDPFGLAPAK